jgi:hypothetical protein
MNTAENVSCAQLKALHSLLGKWSAHTIETDSDPRAARLAWAAESIGRSISSFKELTSAEAYQLIDVLKRSVGQPVSDRPRRRSRRINSRDLAQAAGTAGRRGETASPIYLVSSDDLARIDEAIERLGWTHDRFDAWLRSSTSPLRQRENPKIRTLADANRVWWALKSMLKQAGRWHPNDERKFGAQISSRPLNSEEAADEGPAA